jgi:hypothetical protein
VRGKKATHPFCFDPDSSPLTPDSVSSIYTYPPVTTPEEKRDRERIEILGELHGEVMIFQPLSIKEISRGGCLVETAFPLHLNSLHDVRLTLGDRSVVLKGRVAHCRISDVDQEIVTYRSGVEFIEMNDRVRDVIRDFIEAIKAGRRSG